MAWAGVRRASGVRRSSGRMSPSPNDPMRVRRRQADVGPTAERRPHVLGQHPDVGARRALHLGPVDAGAVGVGLDVEAVHRHPAGRPLDLHPLAGQLVQPAAPHLDRRHHRGHLLDGAGEGGRRRPHLGRA